MSGAIATVEAYFAECGKGKAELRAALLAWFTPETIWENVGLATTTGPEEALALFDQFGVTFGVASFAVEMLAIAARDGTVLTERIDHLRDAAGGPLMPLRVMGIIEVADSRILAWRDYFDTAGFAALTTAASADRMSSNAMRTPS